MEQNRTRGFSRKTIKKVLDTKIKDWAESIEDEDLKKDVLDNTL